MVAITDYLKESKDWFICEWIMWTLILIAVALIILYLVQFNIPYGRYNSTRINLCDISVDAKLGWFIQELPSLILPLYLLLNVGGDQVGDFNPNIILLSMFVMHYVQR